MIFDWNDFRKLAEELWQIETEAAKRTAISRLYYALYWRARNLLEDEGFVYRQSEQSHQQIWQEFKRRGMTHRAIAFSGLELRDKRVEADYFEEVENIEKLTNSAFAIAEKITVYLEQIEKKTQN
ncbi:MAG TPA: hypothetical protein PKE69_23710 [Pyrinomonadaceae bacterium]|nr:hypothetical protein [Pyrinomonadaceae bacterium]